jgi:Glucodextranase, domain B
MTRSTIRVSMALVAVALLLGACGTTGGSSPNSSPIATPPSGEFAITSPVDGAVSETKTITVAGTAPDGAEVVRDISFAPDDRVRATVGKWSMTVDVDQGENELTFRIGDDNSTAKTITLTYRPTAVATQEPTPQATADPTPQPTEKPTSEPTATPAPVTSRVT